MTRVVLRGGIGSGKSEVARLFERWGATVISADEVGHSVLEPGAAAHDAVAQRWPEVVIDGVIDRRALGRIVFAHPDQLAELEAITHPAIRAELERRVAAVPGVVAVELPLPRNLLEGEWVSVVVDAPTATRRARLLERGMDEAEVAERMAAQPTRLEWLSLADVVVDNSGDREQLAKEAAAAWETISAGP